MNHPLIALCVGHSRRINGHPEGGAVSVGGVSEWTYNCELAEMVRELLAASRVNARIYSNYEGGWYGTAQRWLASVLRLDAATLAVEFHFNSSDNPAATGHEWLYWTTSKNGKRLAECLHSEMCLAVPQLKARGIKPKTASDRGAEFLKGTHCPAVIMEPFFGSHAGDWQTATDKRDDIARAIASGILEFLD
jgi:N-acetylmuramoyl-L-alanine amidase